MVDRDYNHKKVEKKWRDKWLKDNMYTPDIKNAKRPFMNLMMFPYPSAEGLHVGSMYAFGGADVYGRFKRMNGYDVLEPIGLDGFGIHSENYAIKIGRHPRENAKITQKNYYRQLSEIGNSYAWDHRLETYDPDYYKWTQWLFIELFKAGLAYHGTATVNWCPSCKTVLADEQVEDGMCERCGSEVERREMSSWYFKITDYADRLLENIDGASGQASSKKSDLSMQDFDVKRDGLKWPEGIKIAQRKWIGKKAGINIKYKIKDTDQEVICFTTRPDTNFGATFIVVSPEYAKSLLEIISNADKKSVSKYIEESLSKSEQQRLTEEKKKTGVFTGLYALNKLNGFEMPIYVADFVLSGVGTGAVVGVPGHDRRDFEFAQAFDLPIKLVVQKKNQSVFRSYLMGADKISDDDLCKINVRVVEKTESGSRKLEIPRDSYKEYQNLVGEKLNKGFWNEVVGDEIWFLFRDKDGKNKEFVWDKENQIEIAQLCSNYNKDSIEKTSNLICYLASNDWYTDYLIQEHEGEMINSEFLNGMDIHTATVKMMDHLEEKGWGERVYNYHLRDWLISRQRYWGPPIPMIHCAKCEKEGKGERDDLSGWYSEAKDNLPIVLPDIKDFKPVGDGTSPLSNAPDAWKYTKCPGCGEKAQRELDVSDTFLDSSWYFLAYPNLKTKEWKSGETPFNKEITKKWLPVSTYIGGAEHAVLHLLYARFVAMVLKDLGHIDFEEPFPFLFGHGLIIKDGAKMSKSKGNVINPDEYIAKFGADALRCYLMFLGPYDGGGDFRDTGMEGMYRFLMRVWDLFENNSNVILVSKKDSEEVLVKMHKTIKKVTHEFENFKYNTALSSIMEFLNLLREKASGDIKRSDNGLRCAEWDEALLVLLKLLAPFAPHMTEEIYQDIRNDSKSANKFESIHFSSWPEFDPKLVVENVVTIPVQVNGKLRATLELPIDEAKDKDKVLKMAREDKLIMKWLDGKTAVKEIFVPGRLVNFVVK